MGTTAITDGNPFCSALGGGQSQFGLGTMAQQQRQMELAQILGGNPPTFPDVRFRRNEELKAKTFYQDLKEEIANWLKIKL